MGFLFCNRMAKGGAVKGGAKKGAGKKGNEKQKQKLVEDKTFGLKNKKKSAKVQKYVQTVQKQADNQFATGKKRSDKKSQLEDELVVSYNPAVQQKKLEKGVDPKSVICEYFKQGKCNRGNKCRYSHDLQVERKAAKIDIYTDAREDDNMDDWDQDKLEDVVNRKHGWFWECPNGVNCKYRHALPPGYVLKRDRVKEEVSTVDIVETIEEERKLLKTHTPVTEERFLAWKLKKQEEKAAEDKAKRKQRKADIKSGTVNMSGREMFAANPDMFVDDDMAADSNDVVFEEEEMDPSVPVNIITATGTSITRTAVQPKKVEESVVDESLFGGDDEDFD